MPDAPPPTPPPPRAQPQPSPRTQSSPSSAPPAALQPAGSSRPRPLVLATKRAPQGACVRRAPGRGGGSWPRGRSLVSMVAQARESGTPPRSSARVGRTFSASGVNRGAWVLCACHRGIWGPVSLILPARFLESRVFSSPVQSVCGWTCH